MMRRPGLLVHAKLVGGPIATEKVQQACVFAHKRDTGEYLP